MATSRLRVGVAVVVLGLASGACGGDDDELSQSTFAEQANAICAAGNERIDALFQSTFESPEDFDDPEKQEAVKETVEEDIAAQIDDLRDLEPPEDVEDEFEAVLDDAEDALDEIRDMSAEELFSAQDDPFEDVNRRLLALGLEDCAEGAEEEGEG